MKKNVLILGSGGREHAMAWKIAQSEALGQLFVMPGNPGTAQIAMNLPGNPTEAEEVRRAILNYDIDILVCGPEAPLAEGLMDALHQASWNVKPIFVGPVQAGAQLESSKAFAKDFMKRHGIPTAAYRIFQKSETEEALEFMSQLRPPIVLKASGLAAGKGVLICQDHPTAEQELLQLLSGKFGSASETVVIEEFLDGIEFSVFILTDGKEYVMLPEAKDYKRIGEGDSGPNTGGMGAVSPVAFADAELMDKVTKRIIQPTLSGLQKENIEYKGFLFFGLMVVQGEPYVIEYNCRMGDPETEVVLPRLQSDLLALFQSMEEGSLHEQKIVSDPRTAVTIMLVSGGYPGAYQKAKHIHLPDEKPADTIIFHAGTKMENYQLITDGGRVLALTSFGADIEEAKAHSMDLAQRIEFEGKYFRGDIGFDLMTLSS